MGVGSTMAVVVLLALRVASAASLPSEVVGPPALEGDLCLTTSATAANGRKQFALRCYAPTGQPRLTIDLGTFATERRVATTVATDGFLVFSAIAETPTKGRLVVSRIAGIAAGNQPEVVATLDIKELGAGLLSRCGLAGTGAITVKSNRNGMYTVYIAIACSDGCADSSTFSRSFVLKYWYHEGTKQLSSLGRFTTGRSTSCTAGNGQRVRALTILPSTGKATIDAVLSLAPNDPTVKMVHYAMGKPHLLSTHWASAACSDFAIAGNNVVYGLCDLDGKQGQVVDLRTGLAAGGPRAIAPLGANYSRLAAAHEAESPVFATADTASGTDVWAISKTSLAAAPTKLFTLPAGVDVENLAVVSVVHCHQARCLW